MSKFGTVVEFNPAADVDVALRPARPSRTDCLMIGYQYFSAADKPAVLDAMLVEFGGVLVRRSLKVFGNYAKRTDQPQVAEYVETLREEITAIKADKSA